VLRAVLGARVDAQPRAARRLADLCAGLPLALRVTAGRASARPYLPLAELAAEVAGLPDRPSPPELAADTRGAVAAVVSASCEYLPPDAAALYRLLGLHPGADWDQYAAAALTATTPDHAERLLVMLADAWLIQPVDGIHPAGLSRYRMHDLLRDCAAGLSASRDHADDRRAALSRLFGYYLAAAQAARDTIAADPVHLAAMARPYPAGDPPAGTYLPPVGRPAPAWAWLDAELANLAAVAAYAAQHGWPGYATRLAAVLDHRLTGGHHSELRSITSNARHAARAASDWHAEASALIELGVMSDNDGDLQLATSYHQQALTLATGRADLATQARALNSLGLLRRVRGDYEHAAHHHQQASNLARQAGDRRAEARALNNLGCALTWLGRYALAADHFASALVAASQVGYRYGAATARANHGKTAHVPGDPAAGAQPVITCAEIGDRYDEVYQWTKHVFAFELPQSPSIPAV
jgi:tetratricopeptide (TPR) repeat protein